MEIQVDVPYETIRELCEKYSVRELSIFGSAVREDFSDRSDIDVLVEFQPDAGIGLLESAALEEDLSKVFGRNVDLVSKRGLNPRIRDDVLGNATPLYAA